MANIREIRRQGYVFSRHTVIVGGGIIAMLLPVRRYGRILAIGVNAPVDRLEAIKKKIIAELKAGISRIAESE